MFQHTRFLWLTTFACFFTLFVGAQKSTFAFTVSMSEPANHYYHITLTCTSAKNATTDFSMPVWTPGYYQIMDYAKAVSHFSAKDGEGNNLVWEKTAGSTWRVHASNNTKIILSYDVLAAKQFVAEAYLDETRGYLLPGALFLYTNNALRHPVTVQVNTFKGWSGLVATGLDSLPGKHNTFYATDFDVLYDSPLLTGNLEVLPSFTIKGIPHNFIGYNLGSFDRKQFMEDLQKIVQSGIDIIGDIPYTHYTFLAIGPGRGGIEHLNSSSLSFSGGEGFDSPEARKRLYSFIAHEYFHHYNVKRIRPIELGPFDYTKANNTKLLWVSEGFTVYYEYLMLRRAGLTTDDDLLNAFTHNIQAYENQPGHLFQSAAQASFETWDDGPFGRTGDDAYKTISYYDKGPALGLMLDFAIRHATNNKQSLDGVMRTLYRTYYQTKKRGFTDEEFRQACEQAAGTPLPELFDYAYTVKPVDYPKYFAYAGLGIDTLPRPLPGAYTGIHAKEKNGALVITEAEWNSPAWNNGLRANDTIVTINGTKATLQLLKEVQEKTKPGDKVQLVISKNNTAATIDIVTGTKYEKPFTITPLPNPNALQAAIYRAWREK